MKSLENHFKINEKQLNITNTEDIHIDFDFDYFGTENTILFD
jgi:hypothetical protein